MHFKNGCDEVHIVFDSPGRLQNTPEYFEHKRRDKSAIVKTNHCCDIITSDTTTPRKWREDLLHCRECLVQYLTNFFLNHMHKYLLQNQTMYVTSFITGTHAQGSLANFDLEAEKYNQGHLAFLRLIGTDYPSPSTHFLQFASTSSPLSHHQKWIDNVRQNVADRSTFDNDMVPSTEALYYHWKRTRWFFEHVGPSQ